MMKRKLKGCNYESLLKNMLIPNDAASNIFTKHKVQACTDISGFGLLGHLVEMLRYSDVSVDIWVNNIPILPGVEEAFKSNIF